MITQHPIVRPLAGAAQTTTARICDALAEPPAANLTDDYGPRSARWYGQSLSKGAAGVAILHGTRAQTGDGDWQPVHAWLKQATAEALNNGPRAGLWFGAPAVTHALTIAAPHARPAALTKLDHAVADLTRRRLSAAQARIAAHQRPSLSEFDLVRGLTGLGAHLLRRAPEGLLVRQVLRYLVQLTEPIDAADEIGRHTPGWWSHDPADPTRPGSGSHANLGMAHGITGPLALLALAMRRNVLVPGHTEAIDRICSWLDRWRQPGVSGPWWPEKVTLADLRTATPAAPGPARPSWCYGTPGVARALQLAAIAVGDPSRQQKAEDALTRCLADPAQLARITDPSLCHGWAGVAATAWYAAADARTTALPDHLPRLLDLLMQHANDPAPAPSGLISGHAGVALTLHTYATGTEVGWPTSLLIN